MYMLRLGWFNISVANHRPRNVCLTLKNDLWSLRNSGNTQLTLGVLMVSRRSMATPVFELKCGTVLLQIISDCKIAQIPRAGPGPAGTKYHPHLIQFTERNFLLFISLHAYRPLRLSIVCFSSLVNRNGSKDHLRCDRQGSGKAPLSY